MQFPRVQGKASKCFEKGKKGKPVSVVYSAAYLDLPENEDAPRRADEPWPLKKEEEGGGDTAATRGGREGLTYGCNDREADGQGEPLVGQKPSHWNGTQTT